MTKQTKECKQCANFKEHDMGLCECACHPFAQYAEIKERMNELEHQSKILAELIIEEMTDAKNYCLETEFGDFIVAFRKHYRYSKQVNKLDQELKAQKKHEEITGKAKVESVNPYLICKLA